MPEYISRDDALLHSEIIRVYSKDYGNIDVVPVEYLADIPAADVQPVKRGRWIDHEKFERKNCNVCIECSVCNTWFGHDCIPKTKFCPNCGARMDLKDGDTE